MRIDWEVSRRIALASESLQEAKGLLANPHLKQACKLILVESLIVSRLLFAIETWLELPVPQLQKMQAFFIRVLRLCTGQQNRHHRPHTTDDQILQAWTGPCLQDYIRVARLRHLQRALMHGPMLLQQLLEHCHDYTPNSWWQMVYEDLAWMQSKIPQCHSLPEPSQNFAVWRTMVCNAGKSWKGYCRRALRRAAVERVFHTGCATLSLIRHPGTACEDEQRPSDAGETQFRCSICDAAFNDQRALSVHQKNLHQISAEVRAYMGHPTQCGSCLMEWHTTQRLRQHLPETFERGLDTPHGRADSRSSHSAPASSGASCGSRESRRPNAPHLGAMEPGAHQRVRDHGRPVVLGFGGVVKLAISA